MITISSLAATLTRETAETLCYVARATPPERRGWRPLENGRSILEQVVECSVANQKWTQILRTRIWASYSEERWQHALSELDTLEKATARLRETAQALAEAIEAIPDGEMDQSIDAPWGPYSLARCCVHAYWNMVYHEGQINYVQTLYGDFEEHEPPPGNFQ